MTTPRGFMNARLPMIPGMAAPSPRRSDYKRHSVFDIKQGDFSATLASSLTTSALRSQILAPRFQNRPPPLHFFPDCVANSPSGVPVCNEIETERDPQQQLQYQTIKATASRPPSAGAHVTDLNASATPRGQGARGAASNQLHPKFGNNRVIVTGSRFRGVPSLAVENIDAVDTTTYSPKYPGGPFP